MHNAQLLGKSNQYNQAITKKTKIWFLFVFSLLNWFDLT